MAIELKSYPLTFAAFFAAIIAYSPVPQAISPTSRPLKNLKGKFKDF